MLGVEGRVPERKAGDGRGSEPGMPFASCLMEEE